MSSDQPISPGPARPHPPFGAVVPASGLMFVKLEAPATVTRPYPIMPVRGGGEFNMLAAGAPDAVVAVQPFLETLSKTVRNLGETPAHWTPAGTRAGTAPRGAACWISVICANIALARAFIIAAT